MIASLALLLSLGQAPQRAVVVLEAPRPGADSATSAAVALTIDRLHAALRADSLFAPTDEHARSDSLVLAAQGRARFPPPVRYWCAARALLDPNAPPRVQLRCLSVASGRTVTTVDRAVVRDFWGTASLLANQTVQALRSDLRGR